VTGKVTVFRRVIFECRSCSVLLQNTKLTQSIVLLSCELFTGECGVSLVSELTSLMLNS
jgi:hypothetical protein